MQEKSVCELRKRNGRKRKKEKGEENEERGR